MSWSDDDEGGPPGVAAVSTADRPGILANVSAAFTESGVNIQEANCRVGDDGSAVNLFQFTVNDVAKLRTLMRKIGQIDGVYRGPADLAGRRRRPAPCPCPCPCPLDTGPRAGAWARASRASRAGGEMEVRLAYAGADMHPRPHEPGYGQPQGYGYGQGPHSPHGHRHADPNAITCPKCHQPSDSIKCYRMMGVMIFIFVGAWWQTKRVVACAGCMRSELAISSAINLFTANLLSPFIFLWHGILFAMTFGKGHSPEVIGYLR